MDEKLIWCLLLDRVARDGRHTVGYFTDEKAAYEAADEHNEEYPHEQCHVWDYPLNVRLSGDFVGGDGFTLGVPQQ